MLKNIATRSGWQVFAVGLIVTLAAIVIILILQKRTEESWEEAYRLGQFDAEIHLLSAVKWQMVAEGEVTDSTYAGYLESTAALQAMVVEIAGNGGEQELHPAYRTYETAMGNEVQALADGDVRLAQEIDEEQVAPAFEVLHELVNDEVTEHASRARGTGGLVTAGTVVAILAAGAILGALLVRHDKSIRALTISLENKVRERTRDLHLANEQLSRLYRDADERANRDSLTGLLNHRQLQERAKEAVLADAQAKHGVALILMDVDRFKTINDTSGHQAGDEILRGIAETIRANYSGPQRFRPGGDEFAILMEGPESKYAIETAERLRVAISRARLGTHATVSVGVAALSPTCVNAEQLILNADRALYRAKSQGRDRVVEWEAELDPQTPESGDAVSTLRLTV